MQTTTFSHEKLILIILAITILSVFIIFISNGFHSTKKSALPMNQDTTSLWQVLNETTWSYTNNWTGGSFVFYEDDKENKKCIHQKYGSGVYVAGRQFENIQIIDSSKIKIGDKIYLFSNDQKQLTSKVSILTLFAKEPLLYHKFNGKPIPIKIAKKEGFSLADLDSYKHE